MAKRPQRKRANGEGSIFQLKDGRWRAVVSIGTVGGKRIRKTRLGRTRQDAREKLKELQLEALIYFGPPTEMLVGDFLSRWLSEEVGPNLAENTYLGYKSAAENHIIPLIGTVKMSDIAPAHIKSMLSRSKAGDRTKQGMYIVCNVAFSHAVALTIITSNPCSAVKKPRYQRDEIMPFSSEETDEILEATEDDRLHAVYRLGLSYGIRGAEIFGMQWDTIDFQAETLRIIRQACEVRGRIVFKPPKSQRGIRTIKMTPLVQESLLERRKIAVKEGHAASNLVFTNQKGKVIHRSNFSNRQWKPLLKRLEIPHRGFHHTRHTAATSMLNAGVPVHIVSAILGHSKPSTTLNVYSHFMTAQQDVAAGAIARYLG